MAEGGRSWLKWSCLGCLALIGLVVLGAAAVVGTAWFSVKDEATRTDHAEGPSTVATLPPTDAETTTGAEAPTDVDLPVLRIVLDVNDADVQIEPGPPGSAPRAEATYDEKTHAFEERSTVDAGGDSTWTIGMRKTSPFAFTMLRVLLGGTKPSVTVKLPSDRAFVLEGTIANGALQAEFDDVPIRAFDLEVSRGAMILEFKKPLATPMESFRAGCDQGALIVAGLGNASPLRVDIRTHMGGGVVDLSGDWRRDADISLELAMGGGSLVLPEGIRIEGLEGQKGFEARPGIRAGADSEVPVPTLRFTVTQRRGEWEIER